MDFLGIGYSNIRLPENEGRHMYEYSRYHTFPEEVFVHEFLHTLERNSTEFGFEIPALHSYQDYGYTNENKVGLRRWYIDYINKTIKNDDGNFLGVNEELYKTSKPINEENFVESEELEFDKEPKNMVELVKLFIYNSKALIERIKEGAKVTN